MNIMANNKLRINVTTASNTATICLSGHFAFDAHREFKTAYKTQLNNAKIGNLVVDL